MELHLFSIPGQDLRDILAAAQPALDAWDEPVVAYLPAASLTNEWQGYTEKAFHGLARVETILPEVQSLDEMEKILRAAAVVYIPGGNTFLLNQRLHLSRLFDYLVKKIKGGLPLLAFSAGTVLCGPNILTSNAMNMSGSTYFNGMNLLPFNFNVHYPTDAVGQAEKDEWLNDYFVFHDNPLLLMADGSYIRVDGKKVLLERGEAWIWRKGQEKQRLDAGKPIKSALPQ